MKTLRIVLNVVLALVALFLGFRLYQVIQEPVEFKREYTMRDDATKARMLDIRAAQKYYLEVNGWYADNFDDLIDCIKNDSLMILATNQDIFAAESDEVITVKYDTIVRPIMEVATESGVFEQKDFDPDQLRYIPYSENVEFWMDADTVERQRVKIPAFEVRCDKEQYLAGLKKKFVVQQADLRIGSLEDGSDAGSWGKN